MEADGNYYLYYSEKDSPEEHIPLCGKPECGHDTVDCNAFLGKYGVIGYCQGVIYYLCPYDSAGNPRLTVWKMNADGTDHTYVRNAMTDTEEQTEYSVNYCFYRDCLIMHVIAGSTKELRVLSLAGGEDRALLNGSEEMEKADDVAVFPHGNGAFLLFNMPDGAISGYLDLETDGYTRTKVQLGRIWPVSADGGKFYFERDRELYAYDPTTNDTVRIASAPDDRAGMSLQTDGTLIYYGPLEDQINADGSYTKHEAGGTMEVYDMSMNPVGQVKLPEETVYRGAMTNDCFFFLAAETTYEMFANGPVYVLKKDQIGKEGCEPEKIR